MRIISGKYGGRKLVSFKADHIRPTTDRVKESLFNIIQGRYEDARVLDLFAGTGNLSLEALSRGAASVEAVEKNSKSIEIIKKNIQSLGITTGIRVVRDDVFKYLKRYQGEAYELIFIDPPFTEQLADDVLESIVTSKVLGPQSLIAIESASKEKIKTIYGELHQIDSRDFGDKILSFYELKKGE